MSATLNTPAQTLRTDLDTARTAIRFLGPTWIPDDVVDQLDEVLELPDERLAAAAAMLMGEVWDCAWLEPIGRVGADLEFGTQVRALFTPALAAIAAPTEEQRPGPVHTYFTASDVADTFDRVTHLEPARPALRLAN